ncbi:hypothetical protein [Epilithonimonas xixisoli]|uniref:Uncharacterized protein n=1 Tax=Epilithonimonas xixisoli TaxID=1476462 RepID=A0A4R8II56_9FLAO|nr:hypothetical protein [Epilithonimonas xixisoli]TDX86219.1 hypothetical protein B0I22_0329 [Epilithonimonas xixisoli]
MKNLIAIIPYKKHVAHVIKCYYHIILFNRHFDWHHQTNFNQ